MERKYALLPLLIAGAILLISFTGYSGSGENTEKPNLVFIVGDDMKLDHFGFIHGKSLTPNIDRLAREGFYFSRTYIPSAACTPTRFSCMTGRLASRCQSPNFINSATPEGVYAVAWNTILNHEPDILPRILKEAGYVTGITGKWHNGSSNEFNQIKRTFKANDDPSDPEIAARLKEMNQAINEYLHGMGFDFSEGIIIGNYMDNPLKALQYHNQEDITKNAVDFIMRNKDRPFFLYMPTTLMHGPSPWESLNSDPRKTFRGLLDDTIDIQPSRQDVIARGRAAGIPDNLIPATWLDDGIGVVLSTLEELGLASNTMVIFMNDQGIDGGKASCYEGGVRVPSVIYWPGRIDPGSSDALVANIDLYPTICEACGIEIDQGKHDGQSLWPIITGEKEQLRDHVYCEWGYSRAIVTDEWKYLAFRLPASKEIPLEKRADMSCHWLWDKKHNNSTRAYIPLPTDPPSHGGIYGGNGTEQQQGLVHYPHYYDEDQLYYLPDDPDEQVNLAGKPEYADALEELKSLLKEWVEEMPGTFGEF